jgi:hypothetical protein
MSAAIAFFVFAAAVAGRLSAAYHAVYDGRGTAYALVYSKRTEGAIAGAGAAFHAPVPVEDGSLFVF